MTKFLKRLIESIENTKLGFWNWILAYISVVFVRLMLESVLSHPNHFLGFMKEPYYALLRFTSYNLFITGAALAVIFVLYIFTKERIDKISKVVILFTPVIWALPLLDFIISKGAGCPMKYVFEIKEVMRFFIHAFNPMVSFSQWASTGLRIEFLLIILLVIVYIYIKTSKLWKSILGFLGGYAWMMFLGLPLYTAYIIDFLPFPSRRDIGAYYKVFLTYGFFDRSEYAIALVWLFVVTVFSILWLYLYNKKVLVSLIKNIRIYRVIHYLGLLVGGVFIGYWNLGKNWPYPFQCPFDYIAVFGLAFALFFAFQYAVVSNDIADEGIDKISNPERPLIKGNIMMEDYKIIGKIFLILSLYFAFSTSIWAFLLTILFIVCYQLYSVPPFRIKKIFPFSTLFVAFNGLVAMLIGFSLLSGSENLYAFPPKIALALLVSFFLTINMKDIKDIEGDTKAGIKTIPTIFGERNGRRIVGILSFIGFISVPIILRINALYSYTVIFGILSYILVTKKKWQENLYFINYYIYYVIVLVSIWRQHHA
ncbi:MAG: UbiA prenyltransferase family protein [Endomicrobiales bacterium]|nr:UbiA prenyltransferase family protein [Endomicrobiales bacterium]